MSSLLIVSIVLNEYLRKNLTIILATVILFPFFPHIAQAAQCGYANGNEYSSAPQARGSLCVTGTPSSVTGSGPWNWNCTDGAGTVNCSSGICGVTLEWRTGGFGACDCATRQQSRAVWCYRNGVMTDPDQSGCYANAGPKPAWQQSCTPSGCVIPVAGTCDNATVNGCSAGSAFDISSDASNDYWKCRGSNGGANSGQCIKAKPVVACLPAGGQPIYEGQTQCPTDECFVWAGGVGGTNRSDDTTQNQNYRQKIGEVRYDSSLFGKGEYAYTHGNSTQYVPGTKGPFFQPTTRSLDTVALGPKTRIIIYNAPNFAGGVIADERGPVVILNKNLGVNPSDSASTRNYWNNVWATENWSATGGLLRHFPPSTRKKTATDRVLYGWTAGNTMYYPEAHETSMKVECLP